MELFDIWVSIYVHILRNPHSKQWDETMWPLAYPLHPSRLKTLVIKMCSSCKCILSFIPQISFTTLDVQLLIKGISNHLKTKMKLSGKNLPRVTQWPFCLFLLFFLVSPVISFSLIFSCYRLKMFLQTFIQ